MKLQRPSHFKWSGNSGGFTLIELLVAVTILAILATLGFAGTEIVTRQAKKTREIAAAKTLITAYLNYPNDHGGMILKGYDKFASGVQSFEGDDITGPAAQRYPWRLAPYFDFKLEGAVLVNENKNQIDAADHYSVSLFPALGVNAFYMGGYQDEATMAMSSEVVTMLSQATASLLVFASAGHSSGGMEDQAVDGFHVIEPPQRMGPMWSDSNEEVTPEETGNIAPRYAGKAVCAFLDGSVSLRTLEELRDMRLWNVHAARTNDPDYQVRSSGSSGLGGGGGRGR